MTCTNDACMTCKRSRAEHVIELHCTLLTDCVVGGCFLCVNDESKQQEKHGLLTHDVSHLNCSRSAALSRTATPA